MDVYFHGEREGADWRGQVIGNDGSVKARTSNLYPTQDKAIEAVRAQWNALQKQLRAVAA
ncbi:hypothetical protein HFP05_16950 [Rhodanobacter denitrificans]|nr:hypothetical protein [Rhodanobacter denitrificans]